MIYELLKPVTKEFLHFVEELPSQSLGKRIVFFNNDFFSEYSKYKIAILGVRDNRGFNDNQLVVDLMHIRKELYSLCPGNWTSNIIDLGDVLPGNTLEDTYFLLESLVKDLVKNGVLPIIIGGSQDLTYALYKGMGSLSSTVNIVNIDAKLDLKPESSSSAEGFLSRIIMEEPMKLLNYCNLGYQTYFNSQEEIDLMNSLHFEGYRLGSLINDIKISEPILRDADIVSLDLNSIKSSESGSFTPFNPNGFDAREICSLSRYAGLSDRVCIFGIFNYNNNINQALLIAQIIWYFIEGVNFRTKEYPFQKRESYTKYMVTIEGVEDFVFYKSNVSERWWVESTMFGEVQKGMDFVIPCSYEDYKLALGQEIPERWWKILKRSLL